MSISFERFLSNVTILPVSAVQKEKADIAYNAVSGLQLCQR
jgi:hypothetical protein